MALTWANELIIGDVAYPSGDIKAFWTNNGADAAINTLTGASTVSLTYDTAEYVFNASIVKSHTITENPDGSRTVEITLCDGLKWSNGDPMTAKDFVRQELLFSSPAIVDTGVTSTTGTYDVGYAEFNKGETPVFSGVRLIDDTHFAVTVDSNWLPDFFETRYYDFGPEHHNWLPDNFDIADDGEGAYFTRDGEQIVLDQQYMDEIGDTIDNWRWHMDAFSGPYVRTDFDTSGSVYTLELNPNYPGNYEGVKPTIAKIIFKGVNPETMMDELRTGAITFMHMADNTDSIQAGLNMYDEGLVNYTTYDRNGYGAVFFKCNNGPAQFKEVRHALAYLLDRNDFARAVTGGFGMVVNGPYGSGMWMTKQGETDLNERLNSYSYNIQNAIDELVAGGWVLAADGSDYTEGLRYKEVSAEEAQNGPERYPGCVDLPDGRILMPLKINLCSTESNVVSDLLATKLIKGEGTAQAGIEIEQTMMTFNELLTHYYDRNESYFSAMNLSTNFGAAYDMRKGTEKDNTSNVSAIDDERLHQLAVDMLLVEPGDNEAFLEMWLDFQEEWNDYLPALPLFSNTYYDFFTPRLLNYQVHSNYVDLAGVIYAHIQGYEAE